MTRWALGGVMSWSDIAIGIEPTTTMRPSALTRASRSTSIRRATP